LVRRSNVGPVLVLNNPHASSSLSFRTTSEGRGKSSLPRHKKPFHLRLGGSKRNVSSNEESKDYNMQRMTWRAPVYQGLTRETRVYHMQRMTRRAQVHEGLTRETRVYITQIMTWRASFNLPAPRPRCFCRCCPMRTWRGTLWTGPAWHPCFSLDSVLG
jgi:hypothetical protein